MNLTLEGVSILLALIVFFVEELMYKTELFSLHHFILAAFKKIFQQNEKGKGNQSINKEEANQNTARQ